MNNDSAWLFVTDDGVKVFYATREQARRAGRSKVRKVSGLELVQEVFSDVQ